MLISFQKIKKIDSKTTLSYDEQFEVPRFEIKFDGFYETTMRIWPDRLLYKEAIEETRKIYMKSFYFSSGTDTFLKNDQNYCLSLSQGTN